MLASPGSPHHEPADEQGNKPAQQQPAWADGVGEALGRVARTAVQARRSVKEFRKSIDSTAEAVSANSSQALSEGKEALARWDSKLGVSDRVAAAKESVGASSVKAWSALDERFGLSRRMSDADEKLGLTRQRTALLERVGSFDLSGGLGGESSASSDRPDLVEGVAKKIGELRSSSEASMQRAWAELNKAVVKTATSVSQMRPVIGALDPSALCFYDAQVFPGVEGCVALTIDDAPCRQRDSERSMLPEVRALLAEFGAKATFFLCTDFVGGHEAELRELLRNGHEVANHCGADRPYGGDHEHDFETALLNSEFICDSLRRGAGGQGGSATAPGPAEVVAARESVLEPSGNDTTDQEGVGQAASSSTVASSAPAPPPQDMVLPPATARWFRAPHADTSDEMRRVLRRHGFTNVLCDCFANDTVISDPTFIADSLLSLVDTKGGSIVVIHVPERGFREHNLEALRGLLEGLRERQMRVMTVSELTEAARAGGVRESPG